MRGSILIAACLLAGACGGDSNTGASANTADVVTDTAGQDNGSTDSTGHDEPTESGTTEPTDAAHRPITDVIDVHDAIAINVATNGSTDPVVAWTAPDAVRVARLDLDPFELATPTVVSGDLTPIGHPIERPAISIDSDDVVHVAFTSPVETYGSVYYATCTARRPPTRS